MEKTVGDKGIQYYIGLLIFGGMLVLYYYLRIYPERVFNVQKYPFFEACIISFVLHLIMLIGAVFLDIEFDSKEFHTIRLLYAGYKLEEKEKACSWYIKYLNREEEKLIDSAKCRDYGDVPSICLIDETPYYQYVDKKEDHLEYGIRRIIEADKIETIEGSVHKKKTNTWKVPCLYGNGFFIIFRKFYEYAVL